MTTITLFKPDTDLSYDAWLDTPDVKKAFSY